MKMNTVAGSLQEPNSVFPPEAMAQYSLFSNSQRLENITIRMRTNWIGDFQL